MRLEELAARAVQHALARGADEAEAYLWEAAELQASYVGKAFSAKESRTGGLGVRVVRGGAAGFAATAPAGPAEAERAAEQATALARLLPSTGARLADPSARPAPGGPRADRTLAALDADDAGRVLRTVMAALRPPRGRPPLAFASATLRRARYRFAVANSRGVRARDGGARASLEVEARVRGRGQERTGTCLRVGREALDGLAAGLEARRRGEALLGARKVRAGPQDVVLDPEAGALLVQLLDHALRGTAAVQKRTAFAGRLGETVASDVLTVRDGPGCGGPRAQRWDDEGTPARDVTLLDRGVLRGFLLDQASARALALEPTGHGLRGDDERFRRPPTALPMGLRVEPGRGEAADLVGDLRHGVFVQGGLMGLASLDPATGDFSVVAPSAFAVRAGSVAHPLTPTTVSGNLLQLLRDVRRVGGDLRAHFHGSTPSLLAGGLTFGG